MFKLIASAFVVTTINAQTPVTFDQSFWDDFENQPPYEHEWLKIPDLIDMGKWNWYFNMTHYVLQGV